LTSCSLGHILKAFDIAIHDAVDVDECDGIATGSSGGDFVASSASSVSSGICSHWQLSVCGDLGLTFLIGYRVIVCMSTLFFLIFLFCLIFASFLHWSSQ
jgi:hypothetical protein